MSGWRRLVALVVPVLLLATVAAAQSAPPLGRVTKPKFKKFISPIGNFEVEYPSSKDWTLLSGRGDAVLMIAENKTAPNIPVGGKLQPIS